MAVDNHPEGVDGSHYICLEAETCECECEGCERQKKRVLRWILEQDEFEELYGEGSWENWDAEE